MDLLNQVVRVEGVGFAGARAAASHGDARRRTAGTKTTVVPVCHPRPER